MASKEQSLDIRINADADKAIVALENVTEQLKTLEGAVKKSAKSTEGINRSLRGAADGVGALAGSLKKLAAGYIGVAGAMKGVDFARSAAEGQQAADAFNRIFSEMGLNAQEEFDKIKKASMGLIPDSAIQQASVQAVSLGVPIEDLSGLMEVAVAKSREMGTSVTKAFGDLALGIGRGSTQILDNLGLTIKLGDAYDAMAESLHKSAKELSAQEKQQALTNAVLKAGADAVSRYADAGLTSSQKLQIFDAQLSNLQGKIGDVLLPTLMDLTEAMSRWMDGIDASDIESIRNGFDGLTETISHLLVILRELNDVALWDRIGGEGAGALDTAAKGWQKLIDRYGFAISANEKLSEAMDRTNAVLLKNSASERDTVADLYEKNKAIDAQIATLQQLHDKVAQYSGWSGYEEAIGKVDDAIRTLTDAQKKNLEEMRRLKDLGDPYAEISEGAGRAADATIRYSEETIRALKKDNDARIKNAESTIEKLIKQEQRLSTDITKINTDLQQKLAGIERSRVARMEAIENKIREIRRQGMTDVAQVDDLQRQRDEELSKARRALAAGDLESYRRYAKEYEAILGQIEQKQADTNSAAYTGANAAREAQINGLKTLEQMENQYFTARKAQARAAAEAEMAQKQAELESIKAQLEAQKELLNVSKQLAEAITGKTIDLDTSAFDRAIGKISETQRKISELSASPGKVSVDTSQVTAAQQQVQTLKSLTINGVTMRVDADTTPADFGIQKLITTAGADEISMRVNPEWEEAQRKIDAVRSAEEQRPLSVPVRADTMAAASELTALQSRAESTGATMRVRADTTQAQTEIQAQKATADATVGTIQVAADTQNVTGAIEETRTAIEETPVTLPVEVDTESALSKIEEIEQALSAASATVTIEVDDTAVKRAVADLQRPTHSLHTIDPDATKVKGVLDQLSGTVTHSTHVIDPDASRVWSEFARIDGHNTHSVHTIYVRTVKTSAEGGYVDQPVRRAFGGSIPKRFDYGGKVPGYDPTDSDRVPALLTAGEYVIRRQAVDHYGQSLLHALNAMRLPKFADGGSVDSGAGVPTGSSPELAPVNITIGSAQYRMFGEREVAEAFATALKKWGGA